MPILAAVASHLRPTADIAADVLLPGDPGRALSLAQALLDTPLMSNHNRGLWGYSGRTAAGRPLTIQSSGIGGPSVAVVVSELAEHGVRRVVRIGTCRALDPVVSAGEMLVVGEAIAADGASQALGAEGTVEPDAELTGAMARHASQFARIAGVLGADLVDARTAPGEGDRCGMAAVDMGTAALFALGAARGLAVASALVVSEGPDEELGDDAVAQRALRLATAAIAAFEDSGGSGGVGSAAP
jgi:uridine phosphorylase